MTFEVHRSTYDLLCTLNFELASPRRRRPDDPGGVDRGVRLNVGQFEVFQPVKPGHSPLERHFDAGNVTVVRVINLSRQTADSRSGVAHEPNEQTGRSVEVER